MTTDAALKDAMNPETFDVLDYVQDQPVAEDIIEIYSHVPSVKELTSLMGKRAEEIARRREAARRGEASSLSLSDADEDTDYDDRINALVETLEKTKMVFHVKTVAPALEKAIKKSYLAKADPNADREAKEEYNDLMYADILSRAIDHVTLGDGRKDEAAWTPERLKKLQENLHDAQTEKLLTGLTQMVYLGDVFDSSLTADFS